MRTNGIDLRSSEQIKQSNKLEEARRALIGQVSKIAFVKVLSLYFTFFSFSFQTKGNKRIYYPFIAFSFCVKDCKNFIKLEAAIC